ncbi:hypothetical protein A2U01_0086361, partial [Trifolium medium]|nr:hypothetical protein [Trifolium medium]
SRRRKRLRDNIHRLWCRNLDTKVKVCGNQSFVKRIHSRNENGGNVWDCGKNLAANSYCRDIGGWYISNYIFVNPGCGC